MTPPLPATSIPQASDLKVRYPAGKRARPKKAAAERQAEALQKP